MPRPHGPRPVDRRLDPLLPDTTDEITVVARHRSAIAGRRWQGGGACTVIVWSERDHVVVSHEGAGKTTASFTFAEAQALAGAIRTAAEGVRSRER